MLQNTSNMLKEGTKYCTGVNRKDTEKDTGKDTEKDTLQPRSSRSKQTSITYPGPSRPRWASKDGCRFRCILCAVCRVKADRRGLKGHPGLAGWGLGGQVCPGEPEACSLQG